MQIYFIDLGLKEKRQDSIVAMHSVLVQHQRMLLCEAVAYCIQSTPVVCKCKDQAYKENVHAVGLIFLELSQAQLPERSSSNTSTHQLVVAMQLSPRHCNKQHSPHSQHLPIHACAKSEERLEEWEELKAIRSHELHTHGPLKA